MRLLIADDHEVVRRGVRTLLQTQKGWEVCAEASDGFEAIEKAKQVSPDVILLDVSMPGMNGLEAARILRRIVPESEILILSQHESAEMLRQAVIAGARGYVVKSSVGRDLVTAVEKVSRRQPFFDPKVVQLADWKEAADTQELLQRGVALEKALRDSEERYRALVTATTDAVWRADPSGNVIWISPSWTEWVSLRWDTEVRPKWSEAIHPDDQGPVQAAFEESIRTGNPFRSDFRVHVKDGGCRYFSAKAVPVRNPDDSIREWIGTFVDFTERKQAELALRHSELHLRVAQSAAHLATWEWDPVSNKSFLTKEADDLFGFDTPPEDRFEAWRERVYPEDLAKVLAAMKLSQDSGTLETEYRFRHPQRGLRWYYSRGGRINPEDPRLFGILLDITERKHTESALRENETHLRLAQAAAGVGTWEYDPKQHVRKNWSAETFQIFGVSPSALDYHEQWFSRVHPDDRERVEKTLEGAVDSNIVEVEYRYEHPHLGMRWMFSKGRMLTRENGDRVVIGISMDITDRKLAEENLRQEREGLEAMIEERTASLRRLSTRLLQMQDTERRRIARELHDSVGQELVALKIHLEQLKTSKTKNMELIGECENAADVCLTEIRTLSHLLHPPLLDESGLASAARWYVEGFSARSGIAVDLEIPESLTRLSTLAETALFRVLQESLTNIHRHSGSRNATVRLEEAGDSVRLTVSDDGRGIPQRTLERFQTSNTDVGVGLAGMRERMMELGGQLQIHSGTGTTVTATVPLMKQHRARVDSEVTAAGSS